MLCAALLLSVGCSADPPIQDRLDASYPLVNQDSAAVMFPDAYADTPMLVGYIYTECPDVCPMITTNMKDVRAQLETPSAVQFVTITFDPERDTPARLIRYQESFGLRGSSWQFLTGRPATVDSLMARLGIRHEKTFPEETTEPDSSEYFINHTNQITLFDAQGRVRAEYGGSMTPPKHILNDIRTLTQ
jgi:protein SCO1/2